MNYNDVYGGEYLNGQNFPEGKRARVVISYVELSTFEDRETRQMKKQLVLHFHNTDKKLGLNKTNADRLAHMFGPDTEDWIGQQIIMRRVTIQAFGELKPTVRIMVPGMEEDAPPTAPRPPAPPRAPQQAQPRGPDPFGDDAPTGPPPAADRRPGDPFTETAPPPPNAGYSHPPPTLPDDDDLDDIPFNAVGA